MSAKSDDAFYVSGVDLPKTGESPPHLQVLHIEDSKDDQMLFQAACQNAAVPVGWQVADTESKALEFLQALKDGNGPAGGWPDLVILDVGMPEGSGLKVLEYIRATPQLRGLPVVVLTGDGNPELVHRAYELGANSFLAKPVDFAQMVQLASSLYGIWSIARRPAVGFGAQTP